MDCNGCGLVKPGFPDERTFSNVDSYRVFYDVYYDLGRGDYDFVGTVQLDIYGPARVGDKPTYSVDVRDEYDNHVPDTSLGVKVLATHSLADPNLVFATMEVNPPFA
jgi:hypothetical protein